jgi:hypothetical protein
MRKSVVFCPEKRSNCWGITSYWIVSSRRQVVASLKVESGDCTALEKMLVRSKEARPSRTFATGNARSKETLPTAGIRPACPKQTALQGISKERSSDGYQRRAQAASTLRCGLAIEMAACRGLKGWVVKRCMTPEEREEVEKKAEVWK